MCITFVTERFVALSSRRLMMRRQRRLYLGYSDCTMTDKLRKLPAFVAPLRRRHANRVGPPRRLPAAAVANASVPRWALPMTGTARPPARYPIRNRIIVCV